MNNNKYRVLLICQHCDKVYNGTKFMDYQNATAWRVRTILKNTDNCKEEGCGKPLTAIIEEKG